MKKFVTNGACIPELNYMVRTDELVSNIMRLIDDKQYFTINRARQYGKTTTLNALCRAIEGSYVVLALDFQALGNASFASEEIFVQDFAKIVLGAMAFDDNLPDDIRAQLAEIAERTGNLARLVDLFAVLNAWCRVSDKPVVLLIDEVDSAANNQVFLDFLAQLRFGFLRRLHNAKAKTFQSVILAGVTDVKHLRNKIRDDELHKVNSPWNIAIDFNYDMSLSEDGIREMLREYDADHNTGMDTALIAGLIRDYTSGYPFLVSRICQIIDEILVPSAFATLSEAWTPYGIDEAVRILLTERNMLFESLMGKLTNYPNLKRALKDVLLKGEVLESLPDDEEQEQLRMYGFIRTKDNAVAVSNKIFEMRLYKQFLGESKKEDIYRQEAASIKSIFVQDGWLNVPLILERFIESQNRIHGPVTEKFVEDEGRERFLTYLTPIINGNGTYSIESQTRDRRRMDVEIHYLGKRYIIEIKIWHGERYHQKGEQQIIDYLDYFGLNTGYMLSFNFNKNKKSGVERIMIGDKVLYEGTV